MLNHIDKDRIDRYIRNSTDRYENILMEIIFSNGQDDPELYDYLKKDWDNEPAVYTNLKPELRLILDHIHHLIPIRQNHEKHLAAPAIYSFAAILILPLLILGDDQSPFMLSAGNSILKGIGTSFNICAYQKDQFTEVIVRQGKIEFYPGAIGYRMAPCIWMAYFTRRRLPYTRKQCKP